MLGAARVAGSRQLEEAAGGVLGVAQEGGWRSATAERIARRRSAVALPHRGGGGWATPAPAHRKRREEAVALLV